MEPARRPPPRGPGRRKAPARVFTRDRGDFLRGPCRRVQLEQVEGDGGGDLAVACRSHVQVVTDVVYRVDLPGVRRVTYRRVEIEYGVELVTGANPCVDGLAGFLTESGRVVVAGVAPERGYRRALNADARRVGPGDDLLVGGDDVGRDLLLVRFGGGGGADVVDAFPDDQPLCAALR